MFKSLKILLIVLGLGIFILPKQMLFAQQTEICCDQQNTAENCCDNPGQENCHSTDSNKNSKENNCADDCSNCHSCATHFYFNAISPDYFEVERNEMQQISRLFCYGISFFDSELQNIWQPPKIA